MILIFKINYFLLAVSLWSLTFPIMLTVNYIKLLLKTVRVPTFCQAT